jgi:hypothetical protein
LPEHNFRFQDLTDFLLARTTPHGNYDYTDGRTDAHGQTNIESLKYDTTADI